GTLAGLLPAAGAAHVGDARGGCLAVDAADVLVDELGFVAGGFDAGGVGDQGRHSIRVWRKAAADCKEAATGRPGAGPGRRGSPRGGAAIAPYSRRRRPARRRSRTW